MNSRPVDPNLGLLVDDRYEIVRRMARGGMATVYEGRDRRLDRRIAIKLMHPHLAESSDFVARFRREARAAARLSHPNVVAIHDQGTWHETGYLVMEHVGGPNLRQELRRRGSFTVGEALDVLDQVLDALGAAHRAGLVHRDIKPENVMIEPGAGRLQVKVTDFGLARAVTEATAATTGTVLGTVAYLAPEIVTHGVADPRADIYAAGIMLFELLTGRTPLEGESPIQIAYQHVHDSIPVPSSVEEWIPQEVDELVAAMTARESVERPQDADAARALVRRCRADLDEATLARRAEVAPPAATEETMVGGIDPITDEAVGAGASDLPHEAHGSSAAAPSDEDASVLPASEHETAHEAGLRTAVLQLHPGQEGAGSAAGSGSSDAPERDHGNELLSVPIGSIEDKDTRDKALRRKRRRRRLWVLWTVLLLVLAAAAAAAWWFLLGPGAMRQVPDVAGNTPDGAVAVLAEHDIEANRTEVHDDDIPAGQVIGTDPGAGAQVRMGSSVDLQVSLGVLMVDVPEVAGRTQDEAVTALNGAGLTDVSVSEEYDDDVPAGHVIDTTPAAGQNVDHRTPVSVVVSQGPAPVEVPEVVGVAQAQAESTLANLGLSMEVTGTANDDTVPQGAVLDQQPAAGESLRRGDSVQVRISEGPVMVEVPNLVGKQVGQARRTLEEAGFRVEVNEVLGGFFGTVRSQEPAAETMAPRGSTVRLTVV